MKPLSNIERGLVLGGSGLLLFVFGYLSSGPSRSELEFLEKINMLQNQVERLTSENKELAQTVSSQSSDLSYLRNQIVVTKSEKKEEPKPKEPQKPASPREVVENSLWDGSVSQVERYLKNTLNDWGSYKSVQWFKVVKLMGGGFSVRHTFRAKNAFGGYVLQDMTFYLDSAGAVTHAQ